MQPKSNNLFHFTKSLEYLKGILMNGFMPRYCLEDCMPLEADHIAYPMVCFCDIPISRISEHTAFYGRYGIGMSKEWGLKNQLAPILYTPSHGKLAALARFLGDNMSSSADPHPDEIGRLKASMHDHFYDIIPMIKPIVGTMVVAGELVEKDFFQENEWRYVPEHDSLLVRDDFDQRRDEQNKRMEAKRLSFSPNDVRYIFVKSDFEIPQVFDFIQTSLASFPLNDIKILTTRITSLETLSQDV